MDLFIRRYRSEGAVYSEISPAAAWIRSFVDSEKPWPIELVTEMVGARFALARRGPRSNGRGADIAIDFDFKGPMMKDLEAVLRYGTCLRSAHFPNSKDTSKRAAGIYRITDLRGRCWRIRSSLVQLRGQQPQALRPRLHGRPAYSDASMPGPFLSALEYGSRTSNPRSRPTPPGKPRKPPSFECHRTRPWISTNPFSWFWIRLRNFDGEFNLTVNNVRQQPPAAVRDASLKVVVAEGAIDGAHVGNRCGCAVHREKSVSKPEEGTAKAKTSSLSAGKNGYR